jgi:hypothetical protein
VYETVILAEFEDIREELQANEDAIIAFLEYFEKTWVGRRLSRTRKRALFPVPAWNHHKSLLTGVIGVRILKSISVPPPPPPMVLFLFHSPGHIN